MFNININRRKNKDKSKLSLSELIWIGFNYTVSLTFTLTLSFLILSTANPGDSLHLGIHTLWIILIDGIVAAACGWAYSRMSQVHKPGNGGTYIYVRANLGKFWGWALGFLMFSMAPISMAYLSISMIRNNFIDPSSFVYAHWGQWNNLGLDLIGIGVYALSTISILFGMRLFKKAVFGAMYMKWFASILIIIATVALFIMNGTHVINNTAQHYSSVNANTFSIGFSTLFMIFLGFETYSTAGGNYKDLRKNLSKAIMIVLVVAAIFFIVITVLMLGAIVVDNTKGFSSNPQLQIFVILGQKHPWMQYAGVVIIIVSTVSIKISSSMQNALYANGVLLPLAVEGFIPQWFAKTNKDGISNRAIIFKMLFSITWVIPWLIVPDIIHGLNNSVYVFNYADLSAVVSLFMFIMYYFVVGIAIKLSLTSKIEFRWWEVLMWILLLCFLSWQIIYWFKNLANQFKESSTLVTSAIEIGYIGLVMIFIVVWYYSYYFPRYKRRLLKNPNIQVNLDSAFKLIESNSPKKVFNIKNIFKRKF